MVALPVRMLHYSKSDGGKKREGCETVAVVAEGEGGGLEYD